MIAFAVVLVFLPNILAQENVVPLHYDITIVPEISSLTFESESTVTIQVTNPVNSVTLNAKNLQIRDPVKVLDPTGTEVAGVSFTANEDTETVILQFESPLTSGLLYSITFTYSGKINENLEGLYVSKYTKSVEGNSEERPFLLTNFHYTKARQVFPCFDRPDFPATFSLSVVRPNDYVVVTNQVKISESVYNEANNLIKDDFAKTDAMPVHLVSFALIDFNQTDYSDLTVYSIKEEGTEFMGEWSAAVAEKFQATESFRFSKIQQIVVPDKSLPVDVLENVGLIVYRESAISYRAERETLQDKQDIAKLVAHAIVKQWYKDASVVNWWTNFWTAEGITFYYQNNVIDQLEPSWSVEDQFVVEELENTLKHDAENPLALLLQPNETPESLSKFFSWKSYALVRMFVHLPLPGAILENPDNEVALTWTTPSGYPTLKVSRNYVNNVLTFTQDGANLRSIPISITYEGKSEKPGQNFDFNLDATTGQFTLSSSSAWYIVNTDRLGYFRTHYDDTNLKNITDFLLNSEDIDQISPLSRAVLVEDAFNLAESGDISYNIYLDLIRYFKRETEYIPISALVKTINHLKHSLRHSDAEEQFTAFARDLLQHLYDHVGTSIKPSEDHLDTLNRIQILTWLCDFGYKRCQQEMNETLSTGATSIHPDLQEPVYCGAMRLGELKSFGLLFDEYKIHKKLRILRSMSCTSNTVLLNYYLLAIIDETSIVQIDEEHKLEAFKAVLEKSDGGVDVVLSFVKQHLEKILLSFSEDDISDMFLSLSKKIVTEGQQEMIDAIVLCLDEEQEITYQKLFEDVKKNIEVNTEWRRSHLEIFKNWLDDLEEKTTTESTTDSTTDSTDGEESTTDSTTDSTDGAESTSDSTTDSTDGAESTSDSTTDSTDGAEYFQISLFTIFAYLLIHIAL